MDEEEYEVYLRMIDEYQHRDMGDELITEQLRDEDGIRVDGCYRVLPAPVE